MAAEIYTNQDAQLFDRNLRVFMHWVAMVFNDPYRQGIKELPKQFKKPNRA